MEQKIEVVSPIIVSNLIGGWDFIIFDANDVAHFFKDDADGNLAYDGYDKDFSKPVTPTQPGA